MADSIRLYPEIGIVIKRRVENAGMTLARFRSAIAEHDGPTSATPVFNLYSGKGNIRRSTADAASKALGTTWLSILNEASEISDGRITKPTPMVPECEDRTPPTRDLFEQQEPDCPITQDTFFRRVLSLILRTWKVIQWV